MTLIERFHFKNVFASVHNNIITSVDNNTHPHTFPTQTIVGWRKKKNVLCKRVKKNWLALCYLFEFPVRQTCYFLLLGRRFRKELCVRMIVIVDDYYSTRLFNYTIRLECFFFQFVAFKIKIKVMVLTVS